MLADIIVIALVAVLFILCIRKQIKDHKKGIPSCGLNCGSCSSCAGCGGSDPCQKGKPSKRFRAKRNDHKETL